MFRATILSIFRSIRLYNTAYDMLYPIRFQWLILFLRHQITHRQRIGYSIP